MTSGKAADAPAVMADTVHKLDSARADRQIDVTPPDVAPNPKKRRGQSGPGKAKGAARKGLRKKSVAKAPADPLVDPVAAARPRRRHWLIALSFLAIVVLPGSLAIGYLQTRAVDQYASTAAFLVHREDSAGAVDMMTGLSALGMTTMQTPDADVLYQFIQSQRMVELVDARLDLRALYAAHHETDPLFALDPAARLEELVGYWSRVTSLIIEPDTGLLTLEVRAYTAADAQRVAEVVLEESDRLVNELSQIARDDSMRLARQELDAAAERLKETRLQLAEFRDLEQIVDPTADLAGQMGLISALQQTLAEAMIQRDTLVGTTTNDTDPRILQADRRIEAIERRIDDERQKVGAERRPGSDSALSRVVGEYEGLLVDREFAEQSYIAAMTAFDVALAEARRQSRYLAVHIKPTLAETAIYPRRTVLSLLAVSFLVTAWALFVLVAYSIRDRR